MTQAEIGFIANTGCFSINAMKFTSGSILSQNPKNYAILGSNDEVSFSLIQGGSLPMYMEINETVTIPIVSSALPYTYFKLVFSEPVSGNAMQIREVQLFGAAADCGY